MPFEPGSVIGYTEFRTNLPGGRHANVTTMRACLVNADGTGRHALAEELTRDPDTWTHGRIPRTRAGRRSTGPSASRGDGATIPASSTWKPAGSPT
jgi:hypothetical protein